MISRPERPYAGMSATRVLTLNVWGRGSAWRRRLPLIRDGLVRIAPDLVGLQEVWRKRSGCQAERIADGLGYHVTYGAASSRRGCATQGNALLTLEPVARYDVLPLPVPDGVEPGRCCAPRWARRRFSSPI